LNDTHSCFLAFEGATIVETIRWFEAWNKRMGLDPARAPSSPAKSGSGVLGIKIKREQRLTMSDGNGIKNIQ
jgi:hypothetical protein